MVEFKAVIADPRKGRTFQRTVSGHHANSLVGKRIGEEFDGIFVSLPGYKLRITGGSDGTGTPMRKDLPGGAQRRVLVSESLGFHPRYPGERRRRRLRGNTISPDVVQINMVITHYGSKPLDDLIKAGEEAR